VEMLFGAMVYSLPTFVVAFLGVALGLRAVNLIRLAPKRVLLSFLLTWLLIAFYVPFLSLGYFEGDAEHRWDLWLAEVLLLMLTLILVEQIARRKAAHLATSAQKRRASATIVQDA
jgi:hypothetical protein